MLFPIKTIALNKNKTKFTKTPILDDWQYIRRAGSRVMAEKPDQATWGEGDGEGSVCSRTEKQMFKKFTLANVQISGRSS